MNDRSRVETTSAEDKSIGFDFQYYYFLNQLLNLKSGQRVGFEVLDDVHIELADGTNLLVQLKHTVQTNAGGEPVNLTTLDADLWKSISNWCLLIADKVESRIDSTSQLAFLKKHSFLLASNKSSNAGNSFLTSIAKFWDESKSYAEFIDDIKSIKNSTVDKSIQGYINDLLNLDTVVSEAFLRKLSFALDRDEIIDLCKTSIAEKQIDASRIDDVFHAVDSEMRANSYNTVKSRRKVVISFDEFNLKYRRYFDKARSAGLIIRSITAPLPADLSGQTFIKQLIDIEDISENDLDFLTKYSTRRLQFQSNIERWIQDGDITQSDIDNLEQEAEAIWESQFLASYPGRRPTADEAVLARNILKEMRLINLELASEKLPITMSHGGIYELSDRPVIGWLLNWKDRYN
ncbi:hypothetical protein [Gluconobacter cerinus]|uniref:CD-NTase associated protein 4-like DNA endonuclease domain-containing protein n=1 Tax=Gluconobacter cerinus TaxID=38307 RepID=A0A1B6VPK7_9PROT|nr:hypothetical protein [Gluconobacter cerinus]OAJ69156.1 hypothetical protein A0123_00210 [Gluconobacter cerinus]